MKFHFAVMIEASDFFVSRQGPYLQDNFKHLLQTAVRNAHDVLLEGKPTVIASRVQAVQREIVPHSEPLDQSQRYTLWSDRLRDLVNDAPAIVFSGGPIYTGGHRVTFENFPVPFGPFPFVIDAAADAAEPPKSPRSWLDKKWIPLPDGPLGWLVYVWAAYSAVETIWRWFRS